MELGNSSSVNGGLRPTEVRLPSGCIEEIDANYKGDLLTDILPNTTSGDMCCQACRCGISQSHLGTIHCAGASCKTAFDWI